MMLFYVSLLSVVILYFVSRWWYGSHKKAKDGIYVNNAAPVLGSPIFDNIVKSLFARMQQQDKDSNEWLADPNSKAQLCGMMIPEVLQTFTDNGSFNLLE
jgi:preprotein translocase subunit Sec63